MEKEVKIHPFPISPETRAYVDLKGHYYNEHMLTLKRSEPKWHIFIDENHIINGHVLLKKKKLLLKSTEGVQRL